MIKEPTQIEKNKIEDYFNKLVQTQSKPINNNQVEFSFNNFPKDVYMIIVFHDENNNKIFDTANNVPLEGYGVSNSNNKLFASPTFTENNIILDKEEDQKEIKVFYYQ